MIRQIEIKEGKGFKTCVLSELTKNNIFICSNVKVKNRFLKKIKDIWEVGDNGEADVIYIYEPYDEDPKQDFTGFNVNYLPTTIVQLQNGQRFIFTVEAPFVLTATDRKDIWFVDENEDGKIYCYAFTDFKDHKKSWEQGVERVYVEIISGIYGCYKGYRRVSIK